jgi:hypothetical protein
MGSRRIWGAGALASCVIVSWTTACGSEQQMSVGEDGCEEVLLWTDGEYDGVSTSDVRRGEQLSDGALLACGSSKSQSVRVYEITGVSPSIAISTRSSPDSPDASEAIVWLARGYLLTNEHPFHALMQADGQLGSYECGPARSLKVEILETPAGVDGYVRAGSEDASASEYLDKERVNGILHIDQHTAFNVRERDGVPFLQAGDRVTVVVRECFRERSSGTMSRRLLTARMDSLDAS